MSDIGYRPPTPDDVRAVADNMRPGDRAELWALGNDDVSEALGYAVSKSAWAAAGVWRGEPVGIMGVVDSGSLISPVGVPWMLGTPRLHEMGRLFWTEAKRILYAMGQDYDSLVNYVWDGSPSSVRFLWRLGFTVHPPKPFGPRGQSFHRFEMRKSCVDQ